MPSVSLTLREALYAEHSAEVAVVLVKIEHDDLAASVYLSSDPTERLSLEPLRYGTVSNGHEYEFVLMSAVLPDDQQDAPPKTTLVFENVTSGIAATVRSITSPATITLSVVLASAPDSVELSYTGLLATRASYDADRVTLDISREPFTSEPCPAGRMTAARFPGLHAH